MRRSDEGCEVMANGPFLERVPEKPETLPNEENRAHGAIRLGQDPGLVGDYDPSDRDDARGEHDHVET
jgi:hypothetical protein